MASEGYRGSAPPSLEGKTIEDFDDGDGKDKDISRNRPSEGYPIPPAYTQEPSQPSEPSHIEMSENEKAAKLREYDRLSKLSQRKSKEAAHTGDKSN